MTVVSRPLGKVLGLVLAGGQSRRMGGDDKAWLKLSGRPLVEHVLSRLRPQVDGLMVSSNGDPLAFKDFGVPVMSDAVQGFPGPLAGLAAALSAAPRMLAGVSHVLSVSTDTPFVPWTLREDLEAALKHGALASVAQSRGRAHWVVGLWPLEALETLEQAMREGELRVQRVLGALGAATVPFEDIRMGGAAVDPFFNINTPDDLAEAERLLAARGVPVLGLAGWSGAGKTTLASRLIAAFAERGLRVGTIKHSHHRGPQPGGHTDTAQHRANGAVRVALVTPHGWGVEPDFKEGPEPPLSEVVGALGTVDVVIVEGMKRAAIPKIEVRNGPPSAERPALTGGVIAIAADDTDARADVPVFRRDDVAGLFRFICRELGI